MKRLISVLVVALISAVVQIVTPFLVMIYGWGVQPKSWPVIISGAIAGVFFAALLNALKAEE